MRKIIHIDLDYFYAQVEEQDKPYLKEVPFAVGGSGNNRGVLCTCNYVARRFGVRSAMSSKVALEKCPDLIILPVSMAKYKAASEKIREVFYSFTEKVEPLSLDEAYLDVSEIDDFSNSATLIAKAIKQDIFQATSLTASAGVAPNKLLAKIASDINKPNGLYVITPQNVMDFISDSEVGKLFGVGKVMQEKLYNMDIKTCRDLQCFSKQDLKQRFGQFGFNLYDYCRGVDHREVNPDRVRKSIGVENTYPHDLQEKMDCVKNLQLLYENLLNRVSTEYEKKVSGIFVKLTDTKFNKISVVRQTCEYDFELFELLFDELYTKTQYGVRLLGLGVKLSEVENKQMILEF